MLRPRLMPCLLLKGAGLVKTVRFASPKYVGDPINAVRIFNEKEVDELVFLDIEASRGEREPDYDLVERIAGEAFMPVCYGGGVASPAEARRLVALGVEKISVNSGVLDSPGLVGRLADALGSQSVVVGMDVKRDWLGAYRVFDARRGRKVGTNPRDYAVEAERLGAGEIFLNSVDRDGTMRGFDLNLISEVSSAVGIPVIACGGGAGLEDFRKAVDAGASAVAAGSVFVFMGKHRAVMINYPKYEAIKKVFERDFEDE
jgi:imidazole glycerol-phosphate synthase subunit HisF